METQLYDALKIISDQLDASGKEKFKSGVLDFTSKLCGLPKALDEKNEQQISFLLHSVIPLSNYLNFISLSSFLSGIREAYNADPVKTKDLLLSYIRQIETFVEKV